MTEFLIDTLENLTTDKIYQFWPGDMLEAITEHSGVLNSDPLLHLITDILTTKFPEGPKRKMVVSAVDIITGSYVTFDEKTPLSRLPVGVTSSASIPFVFPNRKVHDMTLMDGGTVWNTNLASAVNRCLEVVDDES